MTTSSSVRADGNAAGPGSEFRRPPARAASRSASGRIFPLLVIFLLTTLVVQCQGPPDSGDLDPSLGPDAIEAPSAGYVYSVVDTVQRGDTFSGLLLRHQLGMQEIARVLEMNRRLQFFSPRDLRAGQILELSRDDYGRLARLAFHATPEDVYVFETQGDSLIAYMQPVQRDIRLRKFEGTIQESFDEAIRRCGGDYRLTLKVADVFAYDVDFFTEVRRGDRFSLLVEERFVEGKFLGYGEILYGKYDGDRARSTAVWFRHPQEPRGGYYDAAGQALRKAFLRSPLNYRRISSKYAAKRFHPILKTWRPHHGVDYAAAEGTPVVAVADGSVQAAAWNGGYGRLVQLRHGNGMETRYGHLSRFAKGIHRGSRVRQGQVIGYVGRSGMATGPHLHYEVLDGARRLDPLKLKNLPAEPIPPTQLERFRDGLARLEGLDAWLLAGQVLESFDPAQMPDDLAQVHAPAAPASPR